MAKSLSNAETGKESVEEIGRVCRAYRLAKPSCRRANTICKKNEVGEWGSGGEERSGLDKRRRIAPKGRIGIARLSGLAFEFRGNCAAERIKPLARLGADRNNSDGCCSRADACAPCGFGYAESSLRCAAVHSRSTALRPKTMASRFLLSSDCRA